MFERIVVVSDDKPGSGIVAFGSALGRRCHARVEIVPFEDLVSASVSAASDRTWAPARSALEGSAPHPPDLRSSLIVVAHHDGHEPASIGRRTAVHRLLRSTREPILLVPPHSMGFRWGSGTHSPRFLVSLGQADPSTLDAATILAQAVDAHVTLVRAVAPIDRTDGAPASKPGAASHGLSVRLEQFKLDRLADDLREHGLSVASVVLTARDAGPAVVDKVRHGYDLMVVGCPEGAGDDELGPVVDVAIAQTEKPVLVVPEDFRAVAR